MILIQYTIHKFLQSKYKPLINLFLSFLIYFCFYKLNLAWCTQESEPVSDLAALMEKNKKLNDNLTLLTQQNKVLSQALLQTQEEHAKILVRANLNLNIEMLKKSAYMKTVEGLGQKINFLEQNQNVLVKTNKSLQQDLFATGKQLYEAEQTIENLTKENFDLAIKIVEQKRSFAQTQVSRSSSELCVFDLDDELLPKTKKRK